MGSLTLPHCSDANSPKGTGLPLRLGVLAASLAVLVLLLAIPLPNENRTAWIRALFDLGHVPLFATVLLCIKWALPFGLPIAGAISLSLAVLAEMGQVFVDRSVSMGDVLRNVVGVLMGGLILHVVRTGSLRWYHLVAAAVLLAGPIAAATPSLGDSLIAARQFPVLWDATSPWPAERWYSKTAAFERVPSGTGNASDGRVVLVPRPNGYANLVLLPVVKDWSGFRTLVVDCTIVDRPLNVSLSVRDGIRIPRGQRRFEQEHTLAVGHHRVVVDLVQVARGRTFSPVDLTRVQSFHISATDLDEQQSLLLHRIYLDE